MEGVQRHPSSPNSVHWSQVKNSRFEWTLAEKHLIPEVWSGVLDIGISRYFSWKLWSFSFIPLSLKPLHPINQQILLYILITSGSYHLPISSHSQPGLWQYPLKLIFLLPPLPPSLSQSSQSSLLKKFSHHVFYFKASSDFLFSFKTFWHLIFHVLLACWVLYGPGYLSDLILYHLPCQPHWPPCYSSNMSGQHSPTQGPSYLLFPLRTLFQILSWLLYLFPWSLCSSVTSLEKSLLNTPTFTPSFYPVYLAFFFLACSEDLSPPDIYFFLTAHTRMKASGEQGLFCKYCCGSSTENSACHTISTQ